MTTLDTRPGVGPTTIRRPPDAVVVDIPPLGSIAPGTPAYKTAVNPWLPWVMRSGGLGVGSVAGFITTLFVQQEINWLAFSTMFTTFLLFIWVMAGHELYDKHPNAFAEAP